MGRAFEFRKARKLKRWSTMAKTFTRIGKDIVVAVKEGGPNPESCLLYTSPSPRDTIRSRMPSSA